jgi:hypothetical protein
MGGKMAAVYALRSGNKLRTLTIEDVTPKAYAPAQHLFTMRMKRESDFSIFMLALGH